MEPRKNKMIIGGAIGDCVHVSGVFEYLRIAEFYGYQTVFLGAAVAVETFICAIKENKPDIVCISYRLSPKALGSLLTKINMKISANLINNILFYFGGTPECIEVAKQFNIFSYYFQGEESLAYIEKSLSISHEESNTNSISVLVNDNLNKKNLAGEKSYYPLLRHHFGLPDLVETKKGIQQIAESEQVDVISLAPDQNGQEYFFDTEKMDDSLSGSGGVPIRSENDLIAIWKAAQTGNYPRLKIYSGTNNLLKWAEMSTRILDIPWATLPLYWYSVLDGRSKRPLLTAIKENIEAIKWYVSKGITVEINESHQWSLRECSDVTAVVIFYIAAYNAKKYGVKKYIAQFMFNTPRLTSATMDLAKMLAKIELIEELVDKNFTYLKQVRAGLSHFSIDTSIAKGQLASSAQISLAIKPHIIHVVSYSEADHIAGPDEVIESCKIVRGVLKNCWDGFPDINHCEEVQIRKKELVMRAKDLINQILLLNRGRYEDPLTEPGFLEEIVKVGILDAPHLKGNPVALGKMRTVMFNGGYECIDREGNILADKERLLRLLEEPGKKNIRNNKIIIDGCVSDDR